MMEASIGSSPRVWGTSAGTGPKSYPCRFIPTGVGNIDRRWPPPAPCSVHPHGCGEHLVNRSPVAARVGSSPRVWGTLPAGLEVGEDARFIPTGVGNIHDAHNCRGAAPVHPHGCGEHKRRGKTGFVPGGSSPRVWGTFQGLAKMRSPRRFIPTGVGNIWG